MTSSDVSDYRTWAWLPTLHSHDYGCIAFRNDRRRERTLDESERAEFGAATRRTRRLGIAADADIEWCMLHSSTFSTYNMKQYVQQGKTLNIEER